MIQALVGALAGGAGAAGAGAAAGAGGAAAGAGAAVAGVDTALAGLTSQLKNLTSSAQGAGQQFQQMNSHLKNLVSLPLKPFITAVKEVQALTNNFVGAFSPNEAKQFAMVLKDIDAVIGEMLLPITRAFRDMLRFVGDVLAGITPQFQAMINDGLKAMEPAIKMAGQVLLALAPIVVKVTQVIFNAFAQIFSPDNLEAILSWVNTAAEVFGPLIPIFVQLAIVLNPLFWILKASAYVMSLLAQGLTMFYKWILEVLRALGLVDSQEEKDARKGNSAGKAAVSTSTTSAQGALTKLQQNAFSIGGSGPDPNKQTANNTKSLLDYFINDFPRVMSQVLAKTLREVAKGGSQKAVDGITKVAEATNPLMGLGLNLVQGRNPFTG